MTEIDVDMAVYAMSQAVEDLLAAARDKEGQQHLAANRQRLIEEVGRLFDSLVAEREAPASRARPSRTPASSGRARSLPSVPQRRVA